MTGHGIRCASSASRSPRSKRGWPVTWALPDVARTPLAADWGGHVKRRRGRSWQDEDVAVLFRRAPKAPGGPDICRALPSQPAQALVEALAAGAQRSQLVPATNESRDVAHDDRAQA